MIHRITLKKGLRGARRHKESLGKSENVPANEAGGAGVSQPFGGPARR